MYDVSIIVPTYKPKKYIFDCLDSLISQTFDHTCFEVIIVINGPKEPYYSFLNKYLETPRIINIRLEYSSKAGVSNARNLGMNLASGKFIGFLDDDDIISPNYIENLFSKSSICSIACSNVKTFVDNIDEFSSDYLSKAYKSISNKKTKTLVNSRSFFSTSCAKLIPRNVINGRKFDLGFDIGEDSLFMFLISDKIKNIEFASEDTIYFRRLRQDSSFRKKSPLSKDLGRSMKLMFKIINIYLKSPTRYNLLFLISREIAIIRGLINRISKA